MQIKFTIQDFLNLVWPLDLCTRNDTVYIKIYENEFQLGFMNRKAGINLKTKLEIKNAEDYAVSSYKIKGYDIYSILEDIYSFIEINRRDFDDITSDYVPEDDYFTDRESFSSLWSEDILNLEFDDFVKLLWEFDLIINITEDSSTLAVEIGNEISLYELEEITGQNNNFELVARVDKDDWQEIVDLAWLVVELQNQIIPLPDFETVAEQSMSFTSIGNTLIFSGHSELNIFRAKFENLLPRSKSIRGEIPLLAFIFAGRFSELYDLEIAYCEKLNIISFSTVEFEFIFSLSEIKVPSKIAPFFNSLRNRQATSFQLFQKQIEQNNDSEQYVELVVGINYEPQLPGLEDGINPLVVEPKCSKTYCIDKTRWYDYVKFFPMGDIWFNLYDLGDDNYGFGFSNSSISFFFCGYFRTDDYLVPDNYRESEYSIIYSYLQTLFPGQSIQFKRELFNRFTNYRDPWVESIDSAIDKKTLDYLIYILESGREDYLSLSPQTQDRLLNLSLAQNYIEDLQYYVQGGLQEGYEDYWSYYLMRETSIEDVDNLDLILIDLCYINDQLAEENGLISSLIYID